MGIYEILNQTGLPVAYSHFRSAQEPPFLVYMGAGQNVMRADDTHYWHENTYQVEYYFKVKDESAETAIEDVLLRAGYQFEKSGDTYIDDEDLFVIYYSLN